MVLYQWASTDITHCHNIAALKKPMTGNAAAPQMRIFLACVKLASPCLSWSRDSARIRVAIQIHTPIKRIVPKVYHPLFKNELFPFNTSSSATAFRSAPNTGGDNEHKDEPYDQE